jgi:hypothetical protein
MSRFCGELRHSTNTTVKILLYRAHLSALRGVVLDVKDRPSEGVPVRTRDFSDDANALVRHVHAFVVR